MSSAPSASKWLGVLVGVLLLAGCGDSGATRNGGDTGADSSGDQGIIGVDTAVADTGSDTGDAPGDTDHAGPDCATGQVACGSVCCEAGQTCGANGCTTACAGGVAPCGPAEACCNAAQECVLDACVPRCATGVRCGPQQTCCAADEKCDDATQACVLACPTQVFCGPNDECCDADEMCFLGGCARPGVTCGSNEECGFQEYCEPSISRCLPTSALPACEYRPTSDFQPQVEWAWTGSTEQPAYDMVMAAPIVINMTDDNGDGLIDARDIPDVLFPTYTSGAYTSPGYVRVVSGDTGQEIRTFAQPVHGSTSLAAGDVDGDGRPEVIAVAAGSTSMIIFEDDGTVKHTIGGVRIDSSGYGGASIADLEQDGSPEIILGLQVFDPVAGTIKWDRSDFAVWGCHLAYNEAYASYTVATDMDLDAMQRLEVVGANCVFAADGTLLYKGTGPNGFIAVGNLDQEPFPEVALVSSGTVQVWEHDFSRAKWSIPLPGGGRGGPPTIANFNDDPGAEIAVAGGGAYAIIDNVVDPATGEETGQVIWTSVTQDTSSNMTGSSVFDFEGDGVAEPVYNDECFLHVYDTRHPGDSEQALKFLYPSNSHTLFEYPLIVDVDNDGNAEIVAMRNNGGARADACEATWNTPTAPEFKRNKYDRSVGFANGIQVFGDLNDNWVPTRRIWNQHTYHITNINESGTVPRVEVPNRLQFNSFRQNTQGDGLFNAPDLLASELAADLAACPATLTLTATVANEGALGVGPGLPVSFYLVEATGRTLAGVGRTTTALLPGATAVVSIDWEVPADKANELLTFVAVVDDPGDGGSANNECNEANNEVADALQVKCNIN